MRQLCHFWGQKAAGLGSAAKNVSFWLKRRLRACQWQTGATMCWEQEVVNRRTLTLCPRNVFPVIPSCEFDNLRDPIVSYCHVTSTVHHSTPLSSMNLNCRCLLDLVEIACDAASSQSHDTFRLNRWKISVKCLLKAARRLSQIRRCLATVNKSLKFFSSLFYGSIQPDEPCVSTSRSPGNFLLQLFETHAAINFTNRWFHPTSRRMPNLPVFLPLRRRSHQEALRWTTNDLLLIISFSVLCISLMTSKPHQISYFLVSRGLMSLSAVLASFSLIQNWSRSELAGRPYWTL